MCMEEGKGVREGAVFNFITNFAYTFFVGALSQNLTVLLLTNKYINLYS